MLALVMCLLVVGVAGVVLRDALRDGTAKRATPRPRIGRARRGRRPPPPPGGHPLRSGVTLLVSSVAIGVLLALAMALAAGAVGVLLRSTVDGG